jgi:integrase
MTERKGTKRKRGNGEGSVHKVSGKNLWRAVVTLGVVNGKRRRVVKYGRTKAEALEELRKLSAAGPLVPTGSGLVSVATVVNRYLTLSVGRLAVSTLASYRTTADLHILPRIGTVPARKCSPDMVRQVLDDMGAAGLSPSKRRHALTVIRRAFKLAVDEKVLASNPAVGVSAPRLEHHEIKPLTPAQVSAFLAEAAEHPLGALFVVAIGTGLRQGELFGLRWSDVDLEARTITVRRKVIEVDGEFHEGAPKSKHGRRTVTLPAFTVDALQAHRRRTVAAGLAACPLVFPSRKGTVLRRQNVRRTMRAILSRAGIDPVRFHDQRHTTATLLLAAGENPKVVMERLGHSRITTTLETYAHVLPGTQERSAARLDAILGEKERDDEFAAGTA